MLSQGIKKSFSPALSCWLLLWTVAMISSCVSGTTATIKLNHPATVIEGKKRSKEVKAGQAVRVGKDAVEIRAPHKVPMLIIPASSTIKTLTVSLVDLPAALEPPPDAPKPEAQECPKESKEAKEPIPPPKCPDPGPSMDDINRLLSGIRKAQQALSRRDPKDGLIILNALQRKYPDLAYLELIRASCLYMMSDMVGARVALEKALKALPDDEDARKLLLLIEAGGKGGDL